MAGEGGRHQPEPRRGDFIGTKFTTGPDGKLYQLPDQQFANLYWFRYDWFNDEKTKDDFKAKYGYDLGVPLNWSAYEDIAEFFTGRDMSYAGGPARRLWQHGLRQEGPVARLALHRRVDVDGRHGRQGQPNGLPVDEWGIRVDENSPSRRLLRGPRRRHQRPAAVYSP
jgi:glycerol transport system substrate-binding protein